MQPPSADRNGRPTALLYARLIDPGTGLDETGGVLIEGGKIAEAQATAEGAPYDEEAFLRLLRLAQIGCGRIFHAQDEATRR